MPELLEFPAQGLPILAIGCPLAIFLIPEREPEPFLCPVECMDEERAFACQSEAGFGCTASDINENRRGSQLTEPKLGCP
jgi:hypothetical protein